MPDLTALGERARADDTVAARLSLDTLQHRADRRRNRKRMIGGAVLAAIVVVGVTGIAIGARRAGEESVQTNSVPDSVAAPTTTAVIVPAPSSTDAPTTVPDPSTTVAAPTTTPPVAPSTSAAPQPVTLDPGGLSTDGLRPVTFDMTADQVSALLGKAIPANGNNNGCGAAETRNLYDPLPGVEMVFPGGGLLRYIAVNQPGVTTLSGIGVGTPVSTLQAKLPSAVRNDDNGRLVYTVFNSDHSRSIAFFSGDGTTVTNMLAGVGDMTHVLDFC